MVRRRHYSYRTEQSYLVWLQRFARFCRTDDLQSRGPEDIKAFLDDLALHERLMVEPLLAYLSKVRGLYEQDRQDRVAGVWLPDGLERKYPKAGEEWPWFWVWPDDRLSRDPRSAVQRRHHVSDWEFQRRIKEAGRKARLNKRVTPHVLRHSFASQMIDRGCDIRTLQELLGHKSVETTMIYTHVMNKPGLGVKSPLDML